MSSIAQTDRVDQTPSAASLPRTSIAKKKKQPSLSKKIAMGAAIVSVVGLAALAASSTINYLFTDSLKSRLKCNHLEQGINDEIAGSNYEKAVSIANECPDISERYYRISSIVEHAFNKNHTNVADAVQQAAPIIKLALINKDDSFIEDFDLKHFFYNPDAPYSGFYYNTFVNNLLGKHLIEKKVLPADFTLPTTPLDLDGYIKAIKENLDKKDLASALVIYQSYTLHKESDSFHLTHDHEDNATKDLATYLLNENNYASLEWMLRINEHSPGFFQNIINTVLEKDSLNEQDILVLQTCLQRLKEFGNNSDYFYSYDISLSLVMLKIREQRKFKEGFSLLAALNVQGSISHDSLCLALQGSTRWWHFGFSEWDNLNNLHCPQKIDRTTHTYRVLEELPGQLRANLDDIQKMFTSSESNPKIEQSPHVVEVTPSSEPTNKKSWRRASIRRVV